MIPNRNYKDSVFRLIFSKKEDLLSLYNAMNETNYTNVEDLEINTLENAIYMSMKNDISFIFDSSLHIYEHQSTDNPNIPLRDLFYVATLYEKLVQKKTLYTSKPIQIPMPKFVVFYNGVDDGVPETSEYRLSDLYELPKNYRERKASREDIDFDLELRVKVLNINAKMHYNIKQQCRTLRDYCIYVEKVRELAKEKTIEEAVEEAITVCIENDVLKDVLINQRAEVKHMSIFEFNEEEEMKKIKEAWKEQGLEEGREEAKGQIIANMFSLGLDKAEIARLVNVTLEQVEECFKRIEDDSNIK